MFAIKRAGYDLGIGRGIAAVLIVVAIPFAGLSARLGPRAPTRFFLGDASGNPRILATLDCSDCGRRGYQIFTTIYRDGHARFDIEPWDKLHRLETVWLADSTIERLRELFWDTNYFDLPDDGGCRGFDASVVTTSFSDGGRARAIRFDHACEESVSAPFAHGLLTLEADLEDLLRPEIRLHR